MQGYDGFPCVWWVIAHPHKSGPAGVVVSRACQRLQGQALSGACLCFRPMDKRCPTRQCRVSPPPFLQGFTNSPAWVNIIANALVLVHMVSAWQVSRKSRRRASSTGGRRPVRTPKSAQRNCNSASTPTHAKALHALARAPCQVYAQPVFQAIEDGFVALRPTLNFVTPKQALLLRFAYR